MFRTAVRSVSILLLLAKGGWRRLKHGTPEPSVWRARAKENVFLS